MREESGLAPARHAEFIDFAVSEGGSGALSGYDAWVSHVQSPSDSLDCVRALVGQRRGTAFIEGSTGRVLTWEEVAHRTSGWATADLGSSPAHPDDPPAADRTTRVGLLVADPLEMAAAFLSALATGVTVAPLDPGGTTPELVTVARRLGLASVVGGAAELEVHGPALLAAGVRLWRATSTGVDLSAVPSHPIEAGPGRGAAVVLSSSGTTGTPKVIPLGLGELLHTARSVVSHLGLEPSDCGYSPLPLFHINGLVVGVLSALVGGHRLVVDRRFSASSFWDVVDRTGATWLNLVPAIISVLAARPAPTPECTARVAFARSASAPLPVATLRRFELRTGVVVLETYGMTEAGSQISANPRPPGLRKPGSVGVPIGLELRIVDDGRRRLPAGSVGHVEIRGPSVVSEYWAPVGRTPTTRPAVCADGWLSTGDLGRLDHDGFVHLVGRDDDVINRGGEKVYPHEVEEVLLADSAVMAAAVVGRAHEIVGQEPVAFVVVADGADHDELRTRLRQRCNAELSRFRRPVEILVVDRLPSGLNGKIRRSELREMVSGGAS